MTASALVFAAIAFRGGRSGEPAAAAASVTA
jgi:hypothetical protein